MESWTEDYHWLLEKLDTEVIGRLTESSSMWELPTACLPQVSRDHGIPILWLQHSEEVFV